MAVTRRNTPDGRAPQPGSDAPTTGATPRWWATELLIRLGDPTSEANIDAIVAWEAAEGGHWNNSATFNPLNTTQPMDGDDGTMNSVGVRRYTSWQQGLDATVATLRNGHYPPILAALRNGTDAAAVTGAVTSSPWGTHSISLASAKSYANISADDPNIPTQTALPGSTRGTGGGALDVTYPGAGNLGTPQPETVQQYLDNPDVASQYGYLTAYLNDPEIGPILAEAAQQGWGANRLMGALSKTNWWKTTSDAARSWQEQQRLDPATAKQRLQAEVSVVAGLAQQLGVPLPGARVRAMANTAIASGWTSLQLQQAVAAEWHYQAGKSYGGEAGSSLQALRQLSNEWLVPISDHTLGQWTQRIMSGSVKPDDFADYLAGQAKSLYPTLADPISKGVTPAQYLQPYAQLASQTLERPVDSFDFTNPRWSKALNTTTADGQRAPMSLSDWQTYLRGLPEYQTTSGARQQASDMALQIARTFGQVAS